MIHNDMTPSDLLTLIQEASPDFGGPSPDPWIISIDLETWGKKPGCAIRSIGANVVDTRTGKAELHTFYRNISDESCLETGLVLDPETEQWWARQGAKAKAAFERTPPVPLKVALEDFAQWYSEVCDLYAEILSVWGNGKEFDISILEHCFLAVGRPVPWGFWNSCDVRTIVWLGGQLDINFKVCSPFAGIPHYALDDAIHQGLYTAKTVAVIRKVWERGLQALQDDHEAAAPVVDGRNMAARQLEAYDIAMGAAVDALNALAATDTASTLAELHKKIKGAAGE